MAPADDATPLTPLCTESVANRPIVCHALDTLISAGITEVAVVAPPPALEAIRTCVENDGGTGVNVRYIAQTSRSDLLGSLAGRSLVRRR